MKGLSASTLTALALSGIAHANDSGGYTTESGLLITPLLETGATYNSNVGKLSSSNSLTSSMLLEFNPGIALEAERGDSQYALSYQIGAGAYTDSQEDNYLDHQLISQNFFRFGVRHGLAIDYAFRHQHEERGTGVLAGDTLSKIASGPAVYQHHNLHLTYVYGSKGGKGRIETSLLAADKRFTNYRDITDQKFANYSTRYKDYQELGGGVSFLYNLSDSTRSLVEVNHIARNYNLDEPVTNHSQDNQSTFYYVGGSWEISGKTHGNLRIGLQNKRYDDPTKDNFNGLSWKADATWSPVEHSDFIITGSQAAVDPDQGRSYMRSTRFDLQWKHQWNNDFYTLSEYQYSNDDYSSSTRNDHVNTISLSFAHQIEKNLEFKAQWQLENKNSTISEKSYKQHLYSLLLNLTF